MVWAGIYCIVAATVLAMADQAVPSGLAMVCGIYFIHKAGEEARFRHDDL